jgi:8-oxo-dGTP diphosphatase
MAEIPKSKDFPDCFYRVTVKALYKKDGKIMIIKKPSGHYELPGGGLDFGENIQIGLMREIMEELGMTVTHVADNPTYAWTWRFEQTRDMEWFYSLVLVYEVEIDFEIPADPNCKYREFVFLSEEEIATADLAQQSNGLRDALYGK